MTALGVVSTTPDQIEHERRAVDSASFTHVVTPPPDGPVQSDVLLVPHAKMRVFPVVEAASIVIVIVAPDAVPDLCWTREAAT
jgi:hypothetical protein